MDAQQLLMEDYLILLLRLLGNELTIICRDEEDFIRVVTLIEVRQAVLWKVLMN